MQFSRQVLNTERELRRLLERIDQYPSMGLDVEFSGPLQVHKTKPIVLVSRANLTGMSLAFPDQTSFYLPFDHRKDNLPLRLLEFLERALCGFQGHVAVHNLKSELLAFRRPPRPFNELSKTLRGKAIRGEELNWHCTLVLAWLLGEGVPYLKDGQTKYKYRLKALAPHCFDIEMSTFQDATGGRDFDQLLPKEGLDYACEDAEIALRLLNEVLWPKLQAWDMERTWREVEQPTVFVLADHQRRGMGFSPEIHRRETVGPLTEQLRALEEEWEWEAPLMPAEFLAEGEEPRIPGRTKAKEMACLWDSWSPSSGSVEAQEAARDKYLAEYATYEKDKIEKWEARCEVAQSKGKAHPKPPKLKAKKVPKVQPSSGLGLWKAAGRPLVKAGRWDVPAVGIKGGHMRHQMKVLEEGSQGWTLARIREDMAEADKILRAFGENLIEIQGQYPDGRLHPEINQTGTDTGRFSHSYPNGAQMPKRSDTGKRVRKAFIPSPGHILCSADYSQIELRVLAHFAKKGVLVDAYRAGADVHQETADRMSAVTGHSFLRPDGKTVNFAIIYGQGIKALAALLGVTEDVAKLAMRGYKKGLPNAVAAISRQIDLAAKRGYAQSLGGRRRAVEVAEARELVSRLESQGKSWRNSEEYREAVYWKGREERKAGNTPIQGSAAFIVKKGMVDFWRRASDQGCHIIMQIHDDVLCEFPLDIAEEAKQVLKESLEGAWDLRVPLLVEPETGSDWSEL